MADSEIAIQLLEDVIIPACGIKKAGDIVTASDCGDSWEWMLQRSRHKVVVPADDPADVPADAPEDATDEVSEVADEVTTDVSDDVEADAGTESESEVETPVVVPADDPTDVPTDVPADGAEVPETEVATETDVVAKLKESIGDKKYRIDDIVERTGLTEEVVVAALTEANGFQKNQQGWWKVVKS